MNKKNVMVGLLWHSFRSGNLGVGALSVCNLKLIDEEFSRLGLSPRYRVIGNSGPCDYVPEEHRDKVEFIHFSAGNFLKSPRLILKKIAECDVVFDIGEGDSYADIYGLSRFLKLSLSKLVSIAKRCPLVLSPQTIGPFDSKFGRIVGTFIMRRASVVLARDFMSRSVLMDLKIEKALEAIDVAFILPYSPSALGVPKDCIRVGLNVSGLLFHGGYNGRNQFGLKCDYSEFTRDLIRRLLSISGVELHLVAHVVSKQNPVEDDYKVCEELKLEFPSVVVAQRFSSPSEAKSYISNMDLFAGARMHATVAAFSSGVPVLPLAYSRKFSGLYESVGYSRVLDMRNLTSEEMIHEIESAVRNSNSLQAEVREAQGNVKARLDVYRSAINQVGRSLLRG